MVDLIEKIEAKIEAVSEDSFKDDVIIITTDQIAKLDIIVAEIEAKNLTGDVKKRLLGLIELAKHPIGSKFAGVTPSKIKKMKAQIQAQLDSLKEGKRCHSMPYSWPLISIK